jgi:hypothetical protein
MSLHGTGLAATHGAEFGVSAKKIVSGRVTGVRGVHACGEE